jgi:hypothetical protein
MEMKEACTQAIYSFLFQPPCQIFVFGLRDCLNLVYSTEIYQCLAVGQATQPRRRGILFLYSLKNRDKNPFLNSFQELEEKGDQLQ